jgi:membrane protein
VAIERDARTGGGVLAAALAFRCFTFLIPFVFVIVTGMPFLGDATRAEPRDLADTFGMSGLIAQAIGHAGDLSLWSRTWLLVVSGIALVFAARGLVRVLRITHGLAWNVPVPRLQRPFTAAGLLIGAMAAILAVGALTARVQDAFGLFGFIPFLAWGVLVVAIWTAVQARLPHADVPWTRLVPGSVLVAVGVQVLQFVTTYWFTRSIESQSETYGALGAALAILVWAYIVGRITVTGAMFNVALEEQRTRTRAQRPGPGERPV